MNLSREHRRPVPVLLLAFALAGCGTGSSSAPPPQANPGCSAVVHAFDTHQNDVWLTMSAHVFRLLTDSYGRYDHQRFITRCNNGQTVLIVNDVTFGKRVPVQDGETVEVRGQYIWNSRGGLIHFTHHAAYGGQGGWIELNGALYQ